MANPDIIKGGVLLDCRKKTIEVGEGSPMMVAVAAMIFNVGQLFLKKTGQFDNIFGERLNEFPGTDVALAHYLVRLGTLTDVMSAVWATQVLQLYWGLDKDKALDLVSPYVWNTTLWEMHFLNDLKKPVK